MESSCRPQDNRAHPLGGHPPLAAHLKMQPYQTSIEMQLPGRQNPPFDTALVPHRRAAILAPSLRIFQSRPILAQTAHSTGTVFHGEPWPAAQLPVVC